MLSRVADSLYWMSRYLERAEHSARLIDVHLNLMLDASAVSVDLRWARVVESLGSSAMEAGDGYAITNALAFDAENRLSIVSSISAARENARQVREQTSSEMWEQLNRLYHEVKQSGTEESWETQPDVFLRSVKEGAHLFQGITDSTMSHGDGWSFIQAGRFLERARVITLLLKVHFAEFPTFEFGQHLEWLGLLKSCTAFEAVLQSLYGGVAGRSHSGISAAERILSALSAFCDRPCARGVSGNERVFIRTLGGSFDATHRPSARFTQF